MLPVVTHQRPLRGVSRVRVRETSALTTRLYPRARIHDAYADDQPKGLRVAANTPTQ